MADELRAAAERYVNSGGFGDSFPEDCIDDLKTLADWAVQQLTAPADVEAEFLDAVRRATIAVGGGEPSYQRILKIFRPLLQRGRADDGEAVDEARSAARMLLSFPPRGAHEWAEVYRRWPWLRDADDVPLNESTNAGT